MIYIFTPVLIVIALILWAIFSELRRPAIVSSKNDWLMIVANYESRHEESDNDCCAYSVSFEFLPIYGWLHSGSMIKPMLVREFPAAQKEFEPGEPVTAEQRKALNLDRLSNGTYWVREGLVFDFNNGCYGNIERIISRYEDYGWDCIYPSGVPFNIYNPG